jgi:hypothetical protein
MLKYSPVMDLQKPWFNFNASDFYLRCIGRLSKRSSSVYDFKASVGNIARLCLKNKTK